MRTLTNKELQIRDQIADLLLPLYPSIKKALEEHHMDPIYGSIELFIAKLYDEDKRLEKLFHEESYSDLSDDDINSLSDRLLKAADRYESGIDNDDEESVSDKLLNYLSNM